MSFGENIFQFLYLFGMAEAAAAAVVDKNSAKTVRILHATLVVHLLVPRAVGALDNGKRLMMLGRRRSFDLCYLRAIAE